MYKTEFDKKLIKNISFILLILLLFLFLKTPSYASENQVKNLPKVIILEKDRYINQKDNSEMVFIEPGEFIIGDNNGSYDEKPEHKVYLDAYLIDVYEVANAQFKKFVSDTGYKPKGPWKRGYQQLQDNHPVRFVTWQDASAYAKWAGKRLPTEAEWEKAAKGTKNNKYPWGTNGNNHFLIKDESFKSYKADVFPASVSKYGCFNMGGGVYEWTNDWYDRYYYQQADINKGAINPQGPEDNAEPEQRFLDTEWNAAGNERSSLKVIRGGGNWGVWAKDNARTSKRRWGNPSYWFNDTGFRCAKSTQ
jgi:formylglycine-generating enzyme required for sulfatase activity